MHALAVQQHVITARTSSTLEREARARHRYEGRLALAHGAITYVRERVVYVRVRAHA